MSEPKWLVGDVLAFTLDGPNAEPAYLILGIGKNPESSFQEQEPVAYHLKWLRSLSLSRDCIWEACFVTEGGHLRLLSDGLDRILNKL